MQGVKYPFQQCSRSELKAIQRLIYYNRNKEKFRIVTDFDYVTTIALSKRAAFNVFKDLRKIEKFILPAGHTFKSQCGTNTRGYIKVTLPGTLISYMVQKNDELPHLNLTPTQIKKAVLSLDATFRDFNWTKFMLVDGYKNDFTEKYIIEGFPYIIENLQGVEFSLFDSRRVEKGEI